LSSTCASSSPWARRLHLQQELALLLAGVVLLAEGVADLHAADERLEALDHERIPALDLGQRRDLARMVDDERRLDEGGLDELGEQLVEQSARARARTRLEAARLAQAASRCGSMSETSSPDLLLDRVEDRELGPRRREVELLALVAELHRADDLVGEADEHLLGQTHDRPVVGERLVDLEHGELGTVRLVDAFVPEVAGELVDPLEPADQAALEVELVRDPEVEVHAERVVVRGERAGEGAAVERLEHGVSTSRNPRPSRKRRIVEKRSARRRNTSRTSTFMKRSA
jgi:hypothetical protein